MKKNIQPFIVGLLLLPGFFTSAQTEEQVMKSRFSVQANLGITSYQLHDVKNFYDEILTVYTDQGVPIPTQRKYGPNVVLGITGFYNIPKVLDVGLGTQYTRTTALSSYADFAGTLKVKSVIWMNTIELAVRKELPLNSNYHLFFTIRGGPAFVQSEYRHDITFYGAPGQSGLVQLKGSGRGPTFEGQIGVKRIFKAFEVYAYTGYRSTIIKSMDGKIDGTGMISQSSKLELEHNLSGVFLNVGIEHRF